jgi:hypothetical protein
MALPGLHFDLYHDDQWNDHIDNVAFESSALTVKYGQADEHGEYEPTEISGILDNRDDDYSFADPASSAWGKIGKGTRARVRVGDNRTHLYIPGIADGRSATPDSAGLSITGDIDIRFDVRPITWRPVITAPFISKWSNSVANQYAWTFYLNTDGTLRFAFSPTGAAGAILFRTSTVAVPASSGRLAVRVTLDVNNGAAGHTVTFYTAPDINGSWTQLGSTVVTAGTTSIFDNALDVSIGAAADGGYTFANTGWQEMKVYAAQIRSSIGGTIVANPDFTELSDPEVPFVDSAGRTWTTYPTASVIDTSVRGTGATMDWVPHWDETGYAAEMSFRAGGITEQLGRGTERPRSSMYWDLSQRSNIVAFWPLEDPSGSTSFESGVVGVDPALPEGSFTPGNSDAFAATQPGVTIESGSDSGVIGTVPAYSPGARQRVFAMISVPDNGVSSLAQLLNFYCTGTVKRMSVNIDTSGNLQLIMRDVDGNAVLTSGLIAFEMNGEPKVVTVLVEQVGANIEWLLGVFVPGRVSLSFTDGTLNSRTYGRFTMAQCGLSPDLNGTGYNMLTVINNDVDGDLWDIMRYALVGWAGETALNRQIRRCEEHGVAMLPIGDPDRSEPMGPQGVHSLIDEFDECGVTELGFYGERRDGYGLMSRDRTGLYNQTPALTLDMRDGVVINPFVSPFDTQGVRNDVTVSRRNGSSFRAVKTEGTHSTADPPEGIGGSFPSTPQVNTQFDERLADQATFRLHLGTTDRPRVPSLEIEMEHHEDLVDDVLSLRPGDIILLQNTGDLTGMPPGDLRLIFLGSYDTFTAEDEDYSWHVVLNCAPGDPWTIGTIGTGADGQKANTDGSSVASTNFVSGTSTTLLVNVDAGPRWVTAVGEFPFTINADGVHLTVTGITGTSNPQSFAVSSTVPNGVHRLIPAGSDVQLAYPAHVGL